MINVNLYFYVDIVLGYGYFEQLIYYDARITFIRVAICIIVDPLLRLRLLSSVLNDKSNRNNFIPTIKSFFRFSIYLYCHVRIFELLYEMLMYVRKICYVWRIKRILEM